MSHVEKIKFMYIHLGLVVLSQAPKKFFQFPLITTECDLEDIWVVPAPDENFYQISTN
jgi:hypothetical protein